MNTPSGDPNRDRSRQESLQKNWDIINRQIQQLTSLGVPVENVQVEISKHLQNLLWNHKNSQPNRQQLSKERKLREGYEGIITYVNDAFKLSGEKKTSSFLIKVKNAMGKEEISDQDLISYLLQNGGKRCEQWTLEKLKDLSSQGYFHYEEIDGAAHIPSLGKILITADNRIVYVSSNENPEKPALTLKVSKASKKRSPKD